MELEAIRVLIRTKMQDGCLPRDSVPRALGHQQLGELRRLRQGLKTSKLMMEVKKGAVVFLFHGDCYLLWMNERPTLK